MGPMLVTHAFPCMLYMQQTFHMSHNNLPAGLYSLRHADPEWVAEVSGSSLGGPGNKISTELGVATSNKLLWRAILYAEFDFHWPPWDSLSGGVCSTKCWAKEGLGISVCVRVLCALHIFVLPCQLTVVCYGQHAASGSSEG